MRAPLAPDPPFRADVAALVRRLTGLAFREARVETLEKGLAAAMRSAGESDSERYLTRLASEPALLDDLVDRITVGETYFFREAGQFDLLRREILPALVKDGGGDRPLRVWSAGCASGEEAYSLAIILSEEGLGRGRVLGTDLSPAALSRAQSGRYTRWSLRGVPEHVVRKYFQRAGRQFELSPRIRQSVDFRRLNLVRDVYPSLQTGVLEMDLILCRNVLIYLDSEMVPPLADRLLASLAEYGWLLLGAADPPLGELVPCEVLVTPAGLAYRRGHGRAPGVMRVATGAGSIEPTASDVLEEEPTRSPASRPTPQATGYGPTGTHDLAAGPEALCAYVARDYELAAQLARQAVGADGGDPALWAVLVRALANQGRVADAGEVCAQALDRHSTSGELRYLLSLVLAEDGRHREAVVAARQALYLEPTLVVGHLVLGNSLARLGDHRGARLAFRNADRLLAKLEPDATVPASDGEPAGRLAQLVRMRLHLLKRGA